MATQKHASAVRFCLSFAATILVLWIASFALTSRASIVSALANDAPPQEISTDELKLEYAQLNLQLVETELKLAEQFNLELEAGIPTNVTAEQRSQILRGKQVTESALERLRSNVAIAREQLAQATTPSTGSPEKIRLRYAEEKIRLAKTKLDALQADKMAGKPVRELEITQLELKYKLAQLKLKLLGSPEYLLEIVDSLQRQIDQLGEEFMVHDQRISAIEDHVDNR